VVGDIEVEERRGWGGTSAHLGTRVNIFRGNL